MDAHKGETRAFSVEKAPGSDGAENDAVIPPDVIDNGVGVPVGRPAKLKTLPPRLAIGAAKTTTATMAACLSIDDFLNAGHSATQLAGMPGMRRVDRKAFATAESTLSNAQTMAR